MISPRHVFMTLHAARRHGIHHGVDGVRRTARPASGAAPSGAP
ncbi:hypothetical protein [Nesterenkonia suensis]